MYSIGLDVSKSSIDVYIPINNLSIKINNDIKSLKSLYSKLKKHYKKEIDNLVFVFEPTGSYSSLLKRFCSVHSIKCFMVNPKSSSNFAKARGQRGKSDKKDAQMLSDMLAIAKSEDIKVPVINNTVEEFSELISYYKLLVKQRTMSKNHLKAIIGNPNSPMIKSINKQIEFLDLKIVESINKIKEIIQKDDNLYNSFLNLKTIKGVADKCAIVLLHHFIKYPNTNQREIVSLAGLDPISRSSGKYQSKARISKNGSKLIRGTLFMAVMNAVQYNNELKAFYERLKANGKPTKVSQVAVIRKMLIIAHSMYKNNESYSSERYKKVAA